MNIDVIIPVFNGARFVRRAVESVLAQELDPTVAAAITIRCIDDGSTDDSWAVLVGIAATDPRIRLHRNPTNVGVAASRNIAVRSGDGALIAFLDQDDVWLPGKLRRQLETLAHDPLLGYVVGLQQFVIEEGETMPAWCRPEWLDQPQAGYLPSTLLVRREAFLQVGFLDEQFRAGGDDADWFARARRLGIPFVLLDETVVRRFVHDHNESANPRTSDDLLRMVRRHLGGSEVAR